MAKKGGSYDSTGKGSTPRLKGVNGGAKSTFKRGDGATMKSKRNDQQDSHRFKRGD